MTQDKNNPIHWIADENKTFVRKEDGFDMGNEIWLGLWDSVENYTEIETITPVNTESYDTWNI